MAGYEDSIAGTARDILEMAKAEQSHRHRMENRETAYPYFGMSLGGVCLLSCIGGAIFVASHAYNEKIGLALIGAPLLTGIGWFTNARLLLKAQTESAKAADRSSDFAKEKSR